MRRAIEICFVLTLSIVIAGLGWLVFSMLKESKKDPPVVAENKEIYSQALKFIDDQILGITKVGTFEEAEIKTDGPYHVVVIQVDGKNAFGGPVRQRVIVRMFRKDNGWGLERLDRGL